MRNRVVSTIACVVLVNLALPAVAFEGRVVMPDGRAVVGARVQVLGGRGAATAGRDGVFRLDPTPPLPFELLVTGADGVTARPIRVAALPEAGPLLVTLDAAATEAVIVLGEAPDLNLPPAAALTLQGRGDLDQRAPVNLTEALESVPGAGRAGDGAAAVPSLRGMAAARTLIVLDEGRVTAERRAGPSASFVDAATIDELEVVRGPGSVAYGSDAFGGLIRARTHIPGPGEPTSMRYTLSGADNGRQRSAAVDVGTDLLGGGLMLGASYRSAGAYDSPLGEVRDSEGEIKGFRAGYQHELLGGMLSAIWRTDLGRDLGKPSSESDLARTWYPEDTSHRATVSWEGGGIAGFSRLAIITTWDQYDLLTNKYTYATGSKAAQLSEAAVLAHDYGLRVEAERALGPARLVLGVDANGRYGLEAVNWYTTYTAVDPARTREDSIEDARRDDLGAYVGLNASTGRLAVGSGLRYDRVTTRNTAGYFGDRSTSNSAVSGFLAATVTLAQGLEAVAQVSRGFRDPLLSDRYYRGISGRGFITGNPGLEAETSRQYDVALRYEAAPVALAAYGYTYRIRDLIERYKSGSDYFFRNRGEGEVRGVEVEATVRLPRRLLVQLALQSQRGEVLDDGTAMDTIPPTGAVLTLRRDPSERWSWLARLAAYRRDDRPGPTEQALPGYTVIDAGVGYRLSEALELQLLGRNLANRTYYGSADATSVLAPGRTIQLSLRGTM